jgi:LysR family transcriptional regulator, transcriptional activator of nhaA
MLLATSNSPLRRALEEWFDSSDIRPQVVGEFEDSALMTVVGQEGGRVFPAPAADEATLGL